VPEIPDLESVRAELGERLPGVTIEAVDVARPLVVRAPVEAFRAGLTGARFETLERRGKFLLFGLSTGVVLVVNGMLTGRFQHVPPDHPRGARTCFSLTLSDGCELRYIDERLMGKVYLVTAAELDAVPQLGEMGPDALDAALTETVFLERLRRYRGQVKNVLVNAKFIGGIGNAYADEILFVAGVHPFTAVKDLEPSRREALYRAMHEVLAWAIPIVRTEMDGQLDRKPRDFLRVHRKGGEPCPRCGRPISEVHPNRRVTSFCRSCQPG
jgi:formamidopyrimidine-DNA glycosylase